MAHFGMVANCWSGSSIDFNWNICWVCLSCFMHSSLSIESISKMVFFSSINFYNDFSSCVILACTWSLSVCFLSCSIDYSYCFIYASNSALRLSFSSFWASKAASYSFHIISFIWLSSSVHFSLICLARETIIESYWSLFSLAI